MGIFGSLPILGIFLIFPSLPILAEWAFSANCPFGHFPEMPENAHLGIFPYLL